LSNRSLVYLRMSRLESALADADRVVKSEPLWAKGHFRKGAALQALSRQEEAFRAFFECLLLEEDKEAARPIRAEAVRALHACLNASSADSPHRPPKRVFSNSVASLNNVDDEVSDDEGGYYDSCSGTPRRRNVGRREAVNRRRLSLLLDDVAEDAANLKSFADSSVTEGSACRANVTADVEAADFECPLCLRLLLQPATTDCGHTFCRPCLDRTLDHNAACPICKTSLTQYLAERRSAVDAFMDASLRRLLPTESAARARDYDAELSALGVQNHRDDLGQEITGADVPVFVCTISFPGVPCPLHVFEPRYRLMVRRSMESGTREFGMACPGEEENESAPP